MNPDRLAELEEERRFLLRSLSDLEREHDAGDVDDVDYRELRDGYTVRAAATLRAIEAGQSALPGKPPVDWKRRVIALAVVVGLIGVVWWVLVASSAERTAGQVGTGLDPRDQRQVLIAQAREMQLSDPGGAAALYADVLADDPDDALALAYGGWTLALDAIQGSSTRTSDETAEQLRAAIDLLGRATEVEPDYADPKCFLGIVNFRFLDQPALAQPWIEQCLDANPPNDVRGLVEGVRDEIEAALSDSTTIAP